MKVQILNFNLFLLIISVCLNFPPVINGQKLESFNQSYYDSLAALIIRTALNDQTGYKLLKELCEIGPRLSGSENSIKAINWAKDKMLQLNFQNVRLQSCTVPRWVRGTNRICQTHRQSGQAGKDAGGEFVGRQCRDTLNQV